MTPTSRTAVLALAAGILAASPAAAQRDETLLGSGFESDGCGGPTVQVMPMGDDLAVFIAGRGGWIINHVFSIGGGGWGLVNSVPTSVTDTASVDTRLQVEPAVHAEINVTDFFRSGAGASFRYTNGIEMEGFTDDDMAQVAGVLTFKFGSF